MKQIKTLGWLVMAAALTTTFAACSSDNNDTPDTPAAPVKSVTITVGAGIDEATTRSAITTGTNEGKTTHTLTFTTGDKLFVRANYGTPVTDDYGDDLYEHVLRGYLTMVGDPTNDGKSASFTGELEQWDRNGNSTDGYTYTKAASISVEYTDDPLGDSKCKSAFATLVHSGTTEGVNGDYTDYGWSISYYYNVLDKLATGDNPVNTLMTKWLDVSSSSEGTGYNKDTKSFALDDAGNTPIVNCTINGLTGSTTYDVTYVFDTHETALTPSVRTDENGTAKFAFFGDESASTHALTFKSGSETKTANLGSKNLGEAFKIFNVTRTAN